MATEQDYWNQMYANACDQNEVLSLRQKLAHREAQIVILRDALIYCKTAGMRLANVDDALASIDNSKLLDG